MLSFSVRTVPRRQSHTVMYYVRISNILRYRNWRALRNEACVVLVQLGRPLSFSLLSISLFLSSLYFSPSLVFSTLSLSIYLSISSKCPCVCKLFSHIGTLFNLSFLLDEKVNAHLPYYSTLKGSGMVSSKRFELMLFFSGGSSSEELMLFFSIFFTDCPFHCTCVCCRRLLKWSRLYSCWVGFDGICISTSACNRDEVRFLFAIVACGGDIQPLHLDLLVGQHFNQSRPAIFFVFFFSFPWPSLYVEEKEMKSELDFTQ